MAEAAEFLYVSCTCESGMRDGLRCADCGGRGILPRGATPTGDSVPADAEEAEDDDGLENLSVTDLKAQAKELGLPTGGTKATLVARIRELNAEESDAEEAEDDGETEGETDGDDSEDGTA